jgi:FdhE protein
VTVSFLSKWFDGPSADRKAVDEAVAELDRLIAARPAFAAPLRWLRALAADLVPMTKPPPVTLSPETARAKLTGGVPLLRGESLNIDRKSLRRRWDNACRRLEEIRSDGTGQALAGAVRRGTLDPVALAESIIAGRTAEIGQAAEKMQAEPGLVLTLLRFALYPLCTALAAELAPLRAGIEWQRGYCPTCGGAPLLGEFRGLSQARILRCGWCADGWEVPRLWCPFCGNHDHERLRFLHLEGEETRYRAAVCDSCGGYVKMVSTLTALPPLPLLVADAATLHLDLAHLGSV